MRTRREVPCQQHPRAPAERKRRAAELHDGLGPHLIVVKNFALLALNGGTDNDQRARIAGIAESASEAIREVREIAQNLRPYQLDRLGLTPGDRRDFDAGRSRVGGYVHDDAR
jgi:signal transduction histidine kinase